MYTDLVTEWTKEVLFEEEGGERKQEEVEREEEKEQKGKRRGTGGEGREYCDHNQVTAWIPLVISKVEGDLLLHLGAPI